MVSNSQIVDLVKHSMAKEGILSPSVELMGHLESEGFISNAIFVKASGLTVDGESKKYELVVKYIKDTEIFKHNNAVQRICKSEHHVYKNVFPALNDILEQHGLDESIAAPRCYGCYNVDNVYVIVLEHLGSAEFEVQDKTRPLNLDHLILLLREHAKIHASSVALKVQQKDLYEKLMPLNGDVLEMSFDNRDVVEVVNESALAAIDSFKGKDHDLYERTCRSFRKLPADVYMDLLELNAVEEKTVLNHGDCWNDNYLFKYEDGDRTHPTNAKLIDFQSAHVHSPVYDISNMIYSVSEAKPEHFGVLLRSYHDSLTHYLKRLDCDPEFFTLQDLKVHWKKYALRGLIVALYTMRVIIAVKPAEKKQDKGFLGVVLDESLKELFDQRVRSIVRHYFTSMEIIDTI